jgi:predicted ribosome quality control (RQC) complex YloA/Tae2 family protein
VGRNEEENHRILTLARGGDILFEVKGCGSPITLLRGEASWEEIRLAAAITARYSDAKGWSEVPVHYGESYADSNRTIRVSPLEEEEIAKIRV